MRILLVGDYPRDPRLGSAKVLLKLQEEFRDLGHACDVLLADDLGPFTGNRHVRQAMAPVFALAAVRRAFRQNGPYDVVDIASAEGLWLGACRRFGGFRRAALIVRSNGLEHLNYRRMLEDHDDGLMHKPWTRRWWYPAVRLSQVAAASRLADRIILLNDGDRAFAVGRRWKNEAAISVVPHGVSSRFLADVPAADHPRGRGILFCGTWDAVKGVRYLADAFSQLVENGLTTNLTVLGGIASAATIRSAFSAKAAAHVTVIDRVPETKVVDAYRSHDVMAFPSSYEGFGLVLLEAMSQRLPVVSTPVGCARQLVEHDRTGLLVPTRDAASLAAALRRLLQDAPLRARLAEAGFERVQGMSWTNTAADTIRVYEHALNATVPVGVAQNARPAARLRS